VRAIFQLLTTTIKTATGDAAAKRSPFVPDFIAHELGNPALAKRWKQVAAKVPLQAPDRYAAAAQEEARFTRITAPRISAVRVAFTVKPNSSEEAVALFLNLVVTTSGHGGGIVESYPFGSGIDCSDVCAAWFAHKVTLIAIPHADSVLVAWTNCPHENVFVPNAPAGSATCELEPIR
jgi:hypothetical protein